ncbi:MULTISPECIES: GAF domain-containing sensor histidine kinase [Staphylococcus]|uniref:GAF domain-containing sensor histidine kinase n=1 Tax=Staphylococcus TaxID=1279 RepID=UPI0007229E61|nr:MULTISPECIES: GAF domain-containing sensor histidine kinase [Staphylococcus]ALN76824.1 GAF domain-containing sensor histidine kinase [Staphylococcus agnetis]MDG4944661.1 GAF domain-containing sensor histidine kinase [Staphylococcus agnetis]NHM74914.1 GAF domain-containing sensor histidine kinase [Staphylococcus sp. 11007852]NJH84934.1 GAF domain-containing protein [Staphylococcus agnetis]NJH87399.1 GAF domain-containing protein [Staphylococcus agnetis]
MEKPTRLALLKEIAEFLNEETELEPMLHGALKSLIQGSDFTTGWVFFIDENGAHTLEADYELPRALTSHDCKYMTEGPCWCVQSYHNKKLTKASNIINCSRINLASQEFKDDTEDITHHATVPLRSGNEQFGLLNVATPHTTHYSDEDLELLESVAFQIGSAIKRIYLTDQEKEAALINERNRLARDLHDSVNQMLFSLKLTAHAAGQMSYEPTSKKAFYQIEQTSQNAVNEMRALIWQLKPVGLEQGLVHAIKQYAQLIHIDVDIKVHGLIDLDRKVEVHAYRIIQEAMNNSKKHANVAIVYVDLNQNSERLAVQIYDKGEGFNPRNIDDKGQHGLSHIKQRVALLNGHFTIDGTQGVKINIEIPLHRKGSE